MVRLWLRAGSLPSVIPTSATTVTLQQRAGYDSSLQMTDNTITNSPSYAVYADAGMVTLTGNQFIDGYYGVYLRDNGYLTLR